MLATGTFHLPVCATLRSGRLLYANQTPPTNKLSHPSGWLFYDRETVLRAITPMHFGMIDQSNQPYQSPKPRTNLAHSVFRLRLNPA